MIDLHSHILYGLDDGASTPAQSLEMARVAAAEGTRVLAATPHSPTALAWRSYSPELVLERVAELQATIQAAGIPLELVAGTEISFNHSFLDDLRRGALLPYAGTRTILLELSGNQMPPGLDMALFTTQVAGYRIILAHPERVVEVQRDPNVLTPLIERGVLMQVTAAALLSERDHRRRATAEALLTHGFIHIMSSDGHKPHYRPPLLAAALQRASALIGEQAARALVLDTPRAILDDRPLTLPVPRPIKL